MKTPSISLHIGYNSDEKKSVIMKACVSMILCEAVTDVPSDLELYVFRTFISKIRSMQKKLYKMYHTDGLFMDLLHNLRISTTDPDHTLSQNSAFQ